MNLRQQIINERVTKTAKLLQIKEDLAFLRYVHSLITDRSLHSFNQSDLIEGGQEKQIDAITIDQDDNEATVFILQAKNTETFSSNALIQLRNGLNWFFRKPRKEIDKLTNIKFKDKILEYRSMQSGIGPSNINIIVAYATNGDSSSRSEEFRQEEKSILDEYNNETFARFELQIWGADELINYTNRLERKNKKVDANLKVLYDTNNPSLIKYHSEGLKGVICTVSALEIANLVNNDKQDAIFDLNIRRFLGSRGAVNADIKNTCSDKSVSFQFWFLNNGITIVCDSFDPVADPDNPHIKIKNMQIVNGCQTAKTLALAAQDKILSRDTRVLLKIFETDNQDLVDKIVLTTNNQNKISSRDLRANSPEQLDMQQGFEKYKYFYERKIRQYDEKQGIDINRILVNELVARSYLAIILKISSDASRRKYKVWGELYKRIFHGKHGVEPYILAALIYRYTDKWLKGSAFASGKNDILRKLANNGSFHLARIVSFLWRKNDSWKSVQKVKKQIMTIEQTPTILDEHIKKGLHILEDIFKNNVAFLSDIDNALKLASLDEKIDSYLYQSRKKCQKQ